MGDKIKSEKLRSVLIVIAAAIITISFIDFAVYYFKYQKVTAEGSIDYEKTAKIILETYMNNAKKVDFVNSKEKINYINQQISNRSYILKREFNGVYRVDTTNDVAYKKGDEFIDKECGLGFRQHSFADGVFLYKKIAPSDRVYICAFDKGPEDYIIGYKYLVAQSMKDTSDIDFKDWVVQNLVLTVIASIFGATIYVILMLWFVMRYIKIKQGYNKSRLKYKNEVKNLRSKLYIEPLTGLNNKMALIRDIETYTMPKLIIIDIDEFNKMNDYYGKEICDNILIYMGNTIRDFAKQENMRAYILQADRFALLENGDYFIDRYEDLADELLSHFKGRMISVRNASKEPVDVEVHNTIGIALEKENILIKAMTALKTAKLQSKDYVCFYKGLNKNEEYKNQIEYSSFIRNAILNNKITLFYQPICGKDGKANKYECLIRIVDSDEIVSPHAFLDVAKRIKRYAELQKMVITKAAEQLNMDKNLILSINISARDMVDGDVSLHIDNILNKYDIADRLIFEIIENESTENIDRIENFIEKAKKMGVKVAIDDFGSGYSNFSYILKLKPDFIKIDGAITKNIDTDNDSYLIARAIVSFARDLGMKTIAEYVHSRDVFEICKKLGVDEFQGYYLGQPMNKIA
ncbi:MAG: GGDEF domain-containing phosphodiesterase [Campylobacter sp.]|nr:GGDEF domain-containing phosphodiesterase [Campylobacter sp.]